MKLLLDNKADVNTKAATVDSRTALQTAVEGGYIEIVKLLLDYGADVDDIDNGRTALQTTAESGYTNIVKLLLDNGTNVNNVGNGRTALQTAAGSGYIDIVNTLMTMSGLESIYFKHGR